MYEITIALTLYILHAACAHQPLPPMFYVLYLLAQNKIFTLSLASLVYNEAFSMLNKLQHLFTQ